MVDHIRFLQEDRVLQIQFWRPEKRNAVTEAMYRAMTEALERASQDAEVGAVLFWGQEDCFTSGNDLNDFLKKDRGHKSGPVLEFLEALIQFPKPLVSAPSGIAVGLGTNLLFHCDLNYAGENTLFRLPFVDLGLCPEGGVSYSAVATLGYPKAAELLLLGGSFDEREAYRLGLVNQVLPRSEVLKFAWNQARCLAHKPTSALMTTKELLKSHRREILEAFYRETEKFLELLETEEAQQRIRQILAKREEKYHEQKG